MTDLWRFVRGTNHDVDGEGDGPRERTGASSGRPATADRDVRDARGGNAGESEESVVTPATDGGAAARGPPRSESLSEVAEMLAAVADGDLTRRMDESWGSEGRRAVAREYNRLVDRWSETVTEVERFGGQVRGATEGVATGMDEAKDASRAVARAVEDISDGARRQHDHIEDITGEMRNLSAATEEVAATADDLTTATAEATDRGETVDASATEAVEVLAEIDDRMAEALDRVEDLEDDVEDIESVVEFITDVASQTHVLSLNASIEAARADKEGAGFAVVAEEVKELASKTQRATDEITASIDTIREGTELTASEMRDTRQRVASGAETITDALDAVAGLVDDLEGASASIEELSEATESQADASQEVVGMLDDVRGISDDTADAADDVAATARRQTTSLVEAATSVETLSERTAALDSSMSDVRVRSSRAAADAETTVRMWHAMGGAKGLLLEELAEEFETETGIPVEMVSKGSYRGTFKATMDAVGSDDSPTVAQLFEIGTTRALDSGSFVAVESILPDDLVDSLLDPVANYYRHDGRLCSLPFNSSNPVLYVNRDAFRAAGLDPDDPPETIAEVAAASEQLVDAGVVDAGVTWANYSWFVEQWFAEADQPLVDAENGRRGTPTAARLASDVGYELFEQWWRLERDGLYHNPGVEARGEARSCFIDGDVAMLIDSTSKRTAVVDGAAETGFDVTTGYFPVLGDRNGVVVGGASLWIPADLPRAEQEAAGRFLAWLAQPAQQVRWHRETGYFPVHEAAIDDLRREGWFADNPGYATAVRQLMDTRDSPATRGARIGPFDTVRTLVEEAYVDVTRGRDIESAVDALDEQIEAQLRAYAAET
jgi:sn-glycerol 3-phosphate transport system substrate-binding protein